MGIETVADLLQRDRAIYEVRKDNAIILKNAQRFTTQTVDQLVRDAAFGPTEGVKSAARWIIRRSGLELGVVPSSIQGLYEARGRKECGGFTVPAINVRGMSYDVARAVFRAALALKAGAFIFELARSESNYTGQPPAEYAAVIIAAALREGYEGPVFIQGDHYQANARKFSAEPEAELRGIQDFARESVEAGYFNIDIDTSTLVDLSKAGVREQQRANFETCAALAAAIRALEPPGITISLGGEIGEVGKQNSTEEELTAFMEGLQATLGRRSHVKKSLCKISVQTGTTHGGVVLPDGSIAKVAIDFETLRKLSALARERYGMAGAVQHGASTLPAEAFSKFPECETAEVHLATEFQNMIYENAAFPHDLKEEIYQHLRKTCAPERKASDSEEQFLYKTRKKAFGPFKKQFWGLPAEVRARIGADLERKFTFLFEKLKVARTAEVVKKKVALVPIVPSAPASFQEALFRAGAA